MANQLFLVNQVAEAVEKQHPNVAGRHARVPRDDQAAEDDPPAEERRHPHLQRHRRRVGAAVHAGARSCRSRRS